MRKGYFTPPVLIILAIIIFAVAILIALNTDLVKRTKKEPSPTPIPSPSPSSDTGREPTGSAEIAHWKVYTDGSLSFKLDASFKYPPNWYLSDFGEGGPNGVGYIVSASSCLEEERERKDCIGFSINYNNHNDGYDETGYEHTYNKVLGINVGSRKIIEEVAYTRKTDLLVDGLTGLYYTQEILKEKSDHTPTLNVALKRGNDFYYLTADNEKLMMQLISTFKFLD